MNPDAVLQLASLPLATLSLLLMYKLTSNHLNHITAVLERLVEMESIQNVKLGEIKDLLNWWKPRID